ncbi:MAG: cytochrome c oxidase accessory protein CcoG [Myxococcota bacterium]
MQRSLPVLQDDEIRSSINKDGSRNHVHPADVSGRFTRSRYVVFAVLIVVYLALPFIQIGGRPAVFLDVVSRRFYLFGAAFNAQDFWLVFFLLTGLAFVLIVLTTMFGRVWCGYACPQTVFLEGVYRRVERFVEGPRAQRLKRNAGPWTRDKVLRKTAKHLSFALLAIFMSHFFLSYFVSLPSLMEMIGNSPSAHPEAFAWMFVMSVVLYGNFAWFREQLCMIICPYGRLQSTMTDRDTLVVGYDALRGEPRGKKRKQSKDAAPKGDCIDCGRCVHVCPTGIDIRNGLQLECVGCFACIDACDTVMDKIGKPRGLVRYDSLNGLEGSAKKGLLRPRLGLYLGVLTAWAIGMTVALQSHDVYEANLLRPPGGVPFVVRDGVVQNTVQVHVVNKADAPRTFTLVAEDGAALVLPMPEVTLPAGQSMHVPLLARVPEAVSTEGLEIRLQVRTEGEPPKTLRAPFLGPGAGGTSER